MVECPEDVQIALRVGFKGTSRKLVEMMEREDPDKQEGWLVLSSTRPGNNLLLFFKPKSEVR